MKKTVLKLSCLLFGAWAATACAETQALPPVVDDSTYPAGTRAMEQAPNTATLADLLTRVERLQAEVQNLRGQVEEQEHNIDGIKRRQDNIYNDLDGRMQKLEGGGSSSAAPVGEVSEPIGGTGVEQAETSSAPPVEETAAPASDEQPVWRASDEMPEDENTPVVSEPSAQPATTQAPIDSGTADLSGDDKQLYQNAYTALKNANYDVAIQNWKQLIAAYPTSQYADKSLFRMGDVYKKVKKDNASAKTVFEQLVNDYPRSLHIPDAKMMLGFIAYEENRKDEARQIFNAVVAKYPGSGAATLAKNKLKQMDTR